MNEDSCLMLGLPQAHNLAERQRYASDHKTATVDEDIVEGVAAWLTRFESQLSLAAEKDIQSLIDGLVFVAGIEDLSALGNLGTIGPKTI